MKGIIQAIFLIGGLILATQQTITYDMLHLPIHAKPEKMTLKVVDFLLHAKVTTIRGRTIFFN